MNFFISHASLDKDYGLLLINLLVQCGINSSKITFTSDDNYSIPNGENIFDWLKSQLKQKPHVVYLLSNNYYSSVACLNEMGAAWVIENDHTTIFLPGFSPSDEKFQDGAINPRKMGLSITNKDRITQFIEDVMQLNGLPIKPSLLNRHIDDFICEVNKITPVLNETTLDQDENLSDESMLADSFFEWLEDDILNEEELLLLAFMHDESLFALHIGANDEFDRVAIKDWERTNDLKPTLTNRYDHAVRRMLARGLLHPLKKQYSLDSTIVDLLVVKEPFVVDILESTILDHQI